MASAFPQRLGLSFLNGRLVIPALAAGSLVEAVVAERARRLDLVVATSAEGRATPGRELIDLGGALIKTRVHFILLASKRLTSWCARLVLLRLPKCDIVGARADAT